MNKFQKILLQAPNNENRVEPFVEDGQEKENKKELKGKTGEQNAKSKKKNFVLSPVYVLLTLLFLSILFFSMSYLSAWYVGEKYTAILLYLGILGTVFMICLDIYQVVLFFQKRGKSHGEEH